MKVIYPWPPSCLNPNRKAHYLEKARKAKKVKNDAWALTKLAKVSVDKTKPVHLSVVMRPGTNRNRDIDNHMAQMKYVFDGIALALGVNDSTFIPTLKFGDVIKGGAVEIEFSQ